MTRKPAIKPIEQVVLTPPVPAEMLENASQGVAVFQKLIPLIPGRYRLIVTAQDVVGGNMQVYDAALEVPRFDEDTFAHSSLILADTLEKVPTNSIGSKEQFVIGSDKVRPRVNGVFRRDEKMYIFLQIYNFQPDEKTRKPQGSVTYQVLKSGTNEVVAEITDEMAALTKDGGSAQVVTRMRLPLESFEPGDYVLKMKVTDRLRNETLTPSATFKVI
jgi:hypothetical protein